MRILHTIPSVNLKGGGPIEWVRQVCPVLEQMGHTCEVASTDDPSASFVADFPVKTHALGPSTSKYGSAKDFIPWLRANASQYDCVISHGIWQYTSHATREALKGTKTPYYVCVHGMLDTWFKKTYPLKHLKKIPYWLFFEYPVFHDAAAILYTCEQEMILARESFRPYKCREVVSPLGTAGLPQNSSILREKFFTQYPDLRGKQIVLFLSRLHVKKGCDLLLEAFSYVANSHPDLHLVMAGPDSMGWLERLQALAKELKIENRITWTGMLANEEKWPALCAADVFALPSHQETFPISVTEATACGVPVLTTYGVNTWREIENDGAGLISHDTTGDFLRILRQWLSLTDAQKQQMRNNTFACFQNRFEIHAAARSLIRVVSNKNNTSYARSANVVSEVAV